MVAKRYALVFVALLTFLSGYCVAAGTASKPNIVVILSDDYGWGSAGCYGADPNLVRTPNIDRLAKEGRRFTDANTTSSVCTPTRYSTLTGRYCWRTSLKHQVLGTPSPLLIEPGRLTIASLLKKHGYSTAAIGKWHLGYGTKPPVDYREELKPGPLELGFDYHFGVPSNHGDASGVYVENHRVFGLRSDKLTPRDQAGKNFQDAPFLGLDAPQRVDVDVMPLLTAKAVAWLDKQTSDKPFFLYLAPVAVHRPETPSAKNKGTSKAGTYGDWIHELDESVGRVLDTLDRKGLAGNTVVLFTSDNGAVNRLDGPGESVAAIKAGLKVCGPFRGGKQDVWEGGFRVPYLLRWPGRVPAGTTCDEMLSLVDTVATVAAVVGEPLPSHTVAAEDSYNMLPAWLGAKYASPIRPDMIVHSSSGNFAIRQGPWKWIEGKPHPATKQWTLRHSADQFKPQLYNLAEDRGEKTDALVEHADVAKRLADLVNKYRDQGFSRVADVKPVADGRPVVNDKPNILLITGDDLGFQLGCYGETAAHTPNMDRIASEGVRFTRGYVTQASCSPSRSSILTGLYPHQNGQIGLAHLGYSMTDPGVPKLPNLLKAAGYFTGIVGKLHVGPSQSFAFDFKRLGFNETRNVGNVAKDFRDLIAKTPTGNPWFAYINYADPHEPHERDVNGYPKVKTDPAQIKLYPWLPADRKDDKTKKALADFQTCVNRMDEGVGLLLKVLRETGHDRDTLIVLVGDNGPPFVRAKVSSFEAGVNVPFLAWWPGQVKGGQVSDKLICTIDIMPTLLSLAGAKVPSNLPGRSLWPLLQGESAPWRETLATEYTSHDPPSFAPQRSIRDMRYKLTLTLLKDPTFKWPEGISAKSFKKVQLKSANGAFIELYDLKDDPYEFKNRSDDPKLADVREHLLKDLQKWREATKDPLLNADALREQILKHRNPPPTPVPAWKKAKKAGA